MPTLPPAAAADTTTQAMSKTDEHSPNRSPFFLIGMTENSPAINAAIAAHTIENGRISSRRNTFLEHHRRGNRKQYKKYCDAKRTADKQTYQKSFLYRWFPFALPFWQA